MKLLPVILFVSILCGCDGWCDVENIHKLNIKNMTAQSLTLNISFFDQKNIKEQSITIGDQEHIHQELFRSEGGRVCGNNKRLAPEDTDANVNFNFEPEEVTYIICEKFDQEYNYGTSEYFIFEKADQCPDESFVLVETPEQSKSEASL